MVPLNVVEMPKLSWQMWMDQNTKSRGRASVQNLPANYILCESLKDTPLSKVIRNALGRGATALLRSSVVAIL